MQKEFKQRAQREKRTLINDLDGQRYFFAPMQDVATLPIEMAEEKKAQVDRIIAQYDSRLEEKGSSWFKDRIAELKEVTNRDDKHQRPGGQQSEEIGSSPGVRESGSSFRKSKRAIKQEARTYDKVVIRCVNESCVIATPRQSFKMPADRYNRFSIEIGKAVKKFEGKEGTEKCFQSAIHGINRAASAFEKLETGRKARTRKERTPPDGE